jgi:CRISPR-associated endonuclease/helicase Cas3
MSDFATQFKSLTGNAPFPWQDALYQRFQQGEFPASCALPTGLGKTNVIAIWLIASAKGLKVPRRLVYVVNRRTVVDQTTTEAEKLRERAHEIGISNLAISTLRGQYADNQEWSEDPSRPAIICGTVDMIGSRLLFSGYGIGMKARPLHAGFLGQDVLLVHDEAHLEPAFQVFIEKIQEEQQREKEVPWPKFRVMELTATTRGEGEVFTLTKEDETNEIVKKRVNAAKKLHLEPVRDTKKFAEQITERAKTFEDQKCAVVVFTRTVDDVRRIAEKLPKDRVLTLTGTMRGKERDDLVKKDIFKRFLPGGSNDGETNWLVCTSAGEVGVNISADHLVCDLSTFESMAQRFGRVNRFGERNDTEVHVIHPTSFDNDDKMDERRAKTLKLLEQLNGDASPSTLGKLKAKERQEAFAPPPTILPTTDILFDAWALTTIKGKLPGRPPVEPYLHGITDDPLIPETQVAWREEVELLDSDELLAKYPPAELLEVYPLKPHELLKEPSYRASKQFEAMAKRLGDSLDVWLMDDTGEVEVVKLNDLIGKDNKDRIQWKTVILPPSAGGLRDGMLNGDEPTANDIADEWKDESDNQLRQRVWESEPEPKDLRLVQRIDFAADDEENQSDAWLWFVKRSEGGITAKKPVLWDVHVKDVAEIMRRGHTRWTQKLPCRVAPSG